MEGFTGEIKMFGNSYAPLFWQVCYGQSLTIGQNTALFSLLGTTYGGDGRTTFKVPDLQGRAPMHQGRGPGLTLRTLGEYTGLPFICLTPDQLPSHTHLVVATSELGSVGTQASGSFLAQTKKTTGLPVTRDVPTYSTDTSSLLSMSSSAITATGENNPHENRQPFTVVNFSICIDGMYPPRN